MIGEQPQRNDACQQGADGQQVQHAPGQRVDYKNKGIKYFIVPLANVIELVDQFEKAEQGQQDQDDQYQRGYPQFDSLP